jgi:TolA-binding protein
MQLVIQKIVLIVLPLVVAGCLKTREEVRGGEQGKVSQQQQVAVARANEVAKVGELEAEIRNLNGKYEALEYKMNSRLGGVKKEDEVNATTINSMMEQMRIFDEKIAIMEARLASLEAGKKSASAVAAPKATPAPAVSAGGGAGQSLFAEAEDFFQKKDWKKAIVAFEKYRETYPKGKLWGEATYKIGVCFQELNLKSDAITFFQQVVNADASSTSARKAKYRLTQLKTAGN